MDFRQWRTDRQTIKRYSKRIKIMDKLARSIDTLDYLDSRDWARKHFCGQGEWRTIRTCANGMSLASCSICKRSYKIKIKDWWNYCPNCGAYMKGK